MPEQGQQIQAVPDGYAEFLRDKKLALPKHQPWQVQQAGDAVRFYRYQYRGATDDGKIEGLSPLLLGRDR